MADSDESTEKLRGKKTSDRKWSGKVAFFLSMIGYTIGLSDVWRFPYLVYRNGGGALLITFVSAGAFLIPYLLVLVVCCMPLAFMETSMSQFSGKGTYRVWDICPLFRGIGVCFAVFSFLDLVVSTILRCWMIEFVGYSFQADIPWTSCNNTWNTPTCISGSVLPTGHDPVAFPSLRNATRTMTTATSLFLHTKSSNTTVVSVNNKGLTAPEEFWQYNILDISDGIGSFGNIKWRYIIYIFVIRLLTLLGLVKSVKTIEKLMYVTATVPVILSIVMWIRAMTLQGALEGIKFLFLPDFAALAKPKVWIEACFMSFYTLGPAWGGFAVIGSHNKFHQNCYRYTIMTTIVDTFSSLLSGLVVFSVLGVMAAETGQEVGDVVSAGLSLTFVTYPKAVTYLPLPQLWILIFFVVMFMMAYDAQVMLLETALCTIEEAFPELFQRRRIMLSTFISVILFFVSVIMTFQNGMYIFQLGDWYIATFSVVLVALLECVIFSWIYGSERINADMELMLGRKLPAFIRISSAFASPVSFVGLLVVSILLYAPPNYGAYQYPGYARALGWCLTMSTIVPLFIGMLTEARKLQGPVLSRLRTLLKPNKYWKPAYQSTTDDHYELDVDKTLRKQIKMNLLGK